MITPITLPPGQRVAAPGFYRMTVAQYHADPCPTPSLSASIAKVLLDKSPRHAWTAHPRLNPDFDPPDDAKFDFGSAAHEIMLGMGAGIVEVDADSWRTKAAQAERDEILAAGKQPILSKDMVRAEEMVVAARAQLADCDLGHVFADPGRSEVVMVWQDEGGIWCRAMLDWHAFEGAGLTVYDLKTSTSAHPSALGFKIADLGYEVQAGFYERGLATLMPELLGRITWRWVFVEAAPPFALTVCELDGAGKVIGAKKAAAAVALWRRCMETGQWPAYGAGVYRVTYPMRSEEQWTEREMSDLAFRDLVISPMLPEPPARPSGRLSEIAG
jgi:hypothetical protein